jgi:hypothetical protein
MPSYSTTETAHKWGCNAKWVRARCFEGMIPLAEKPKHFWTIPEEAEMPPCTGTEATIILENLIEKLNGKEVVVFPSTMKGKEPKILSYLSNWGFITLSEPNDGSNEVYVLSRGLQLVSKIRKKEVEEITKSFRITAGASVGPVSLSAEYAVEKKTA